MDTNLDRELDQLKMSQGMLGQTSQQVAEQVMDCIEYGKLIFSCPLPIADTTVDEMQVSDREGPQ